MRFLAPLQHMLATADPTGTTGAEYFNTNDSLKKVYNGSAWLYANQLVLPFTIGGTLSVGVTGRKQRTYNRSGGSWTLLSMNLYIATAPTGSSATLQVNKNGSSFQTISVTTGTNNANNNPGGTVADGDYLDVDVTAVGSTVAGADATLTLTFVN